MVRNTELNPNHVKMRDKIYGPPIPIITGRMTRKHPVTHNNESMLPLIDMIPEEYIKINIFADIFFVNGLPFMHTKSKNVNFRSIQPLIKRNLKELIHGVRVVKKKYNARGFYIERWHVDNEFAKDDLRTEVLPALLESYARNEHVGFIEESIRVLKERARSTCEDLPFRRYTKLMIKELISGIVWSLNFFSAPSKKDTTYSPSAIVEGRSKPSMITPMICFGEYAHIYVETKNNLNARSSILMILSLRTR